MNEFNERVRKCSLASRKVLAFLRAAAEHAGERVAPPTFDGKAGVGISYRRGRTRFCRFDPKFNPKHDHIFALIPGASRGKLKPAGTLPEPPRKDEGWVKVENMRGAVRLVPLILRAYDDLEDA